MGEGVKPRPRKQSEIFEECCPYYLSIGMTHEEYWCGDPSLPRYFRKVNEIKIKRTDEEAWLNGLYFYDALCSAMSHLNSNKNSHKDYTAKPFSAVDKVDEESKQIEAEAQAEVWMKSWASATQKMFKDK